ncbi:MAG: DegV family protein [Clostridia bacterium]|nr:DegV family protein [Clostridia bacterium]
MKVIITTDSSCDLLEEQLKENNIISIPLYVNLNGEEFRDGVNITPETIFAFVKENKKLPKTSAISQADFKMFFENILNENPDAEIIHIGLSSGLSTTYNNSVNAANEFNGKVVSIDGKNLSTGTGLLVLYASTLAKQGLTKEEIVEKVTARVPYVQASFIAQEIEYLWRGGRCSAVAMFGANLLKIKPRIQVVDGTMKSNGKPRGKIIPVLKQYVDDVLKEYNNPDPTICFVTHTSIEPEIAQEIADYVRSKNIFKEVVITDAGATITSHCGKGTLGILYINDGGNK